MVNERHVRLCSMANNTTKLKKLILLRLVLLEYVNDIPILSVIIINFRFVFVRNFLDLSFDIIVLYLQP